jgi:hypothetical protein
VQRWEATLRVWVLGRVWKRPPSHVFSTEFQLAGMLPSMLKVSDDTHKADQGPAMAQMEE